MAGRPSIYSEELIQEFILRLTGGRSTDDVCTDEDMPSKTTFYRWRQEKPEFVPVVAAMREERLEGYADKMLKFGDRVVNDEAFDPQRCNAAVNAIDKAARLQMPKHRVELSGPNNGPVQTDDASTRELSKAVLALLGKSVGQER